MRIKHVKQIRPDPVSGMLPCFFPFTFCSMSMKVSWCISISICILSIVSLLICYSRQRYIHFTAKSCVEIRRSSCGKTSMQDHHRERQDSFSLSGISFLFYSLKSTNNIAFPSDHHLLAPHPPRPLSLAFQPSYQRRQIPCIGAQNIPFPPSRWLGKR